MLKTYNNTMIGKKEDYKNSLDSRVLTNYFMRKINKNNTLSETSSKEHNISYPFEIKENKNNINKVEINSMTVENDALISVIELSTLESVNKAGQEMHNCLAHYKSLNGKAERIFAIKNNNKTVIIFSFINKTLAEAKTKRNQTIKGINSIIFLYVLSLPFFKDFDTSEKCDLVENGKLWENFINKSALKNVLSFNLKEKYDYLILQKSRKDNKSLQNSNYLNYSKNYKLVANFSNAKYEKIYGTEKTLKIIEYFKNNNTLSIFEKLIDSLIFMKLEDCSLISLDKEVKA